MSKVYKYLIKWLAGGEEEHVSSDHKTVDDVANSRFGLPTADQVQELHGHTIEYVGVLGGEEHGEAPPESLETPAPQTPATAQTRAEDAKIEKEWGSIDSGETKS